jgi:hypothetical protein
VDGATSPEDIQRKTERIGTSTRKGSSPRSSDLIVYGWRTVGTRASIARFSRVAILGLPTGVRMLNLGPSLRTLSVPQTALLGSLCSLDGGLAWHGPTQRGSFQRSPSTCRWAAGHSAILQPFCAEVSIGRDPLLVLAQHYPRCEQPTLCWR